MKKYVLILLVMSVIGVGCDSETINNEAQSVLHVPAWLLGNYLGYHTKEDMVVAEDFIAFKINETQYTFTPHNVILQEENELYYKIITTNNDIVVFNKTSLNSEVNVLFNELNLGWFQKKNTPQ